MHCYRSGSPVLLNDASRSVRVEPVTALDPDVAMLEQARLHVDAYGVDNEHAGAAEPGGGSRWAALITDYRVFRLTLPACGWWCGSAWWLGCAVSP